jgi:hypothetical protein
MTDANARLALRTMITQGGSPDGVNPQACAPYSEEVKAVLAAYEVGGTAKARQVWADLCKVRPELSALVSAESDSHKRRVWTTAELLSTTFPPPLWAVPGLLPVGVSMLGGRPKLGKSWLSLQIAVAVGTAGMVLDQSVESGRVLYLALEDSPRRLQERLLKQQAPAGASISFATSWTPLPDGGLADLQAEIERGGYRLVIVDTLSRALGRADQLDPAEMTVVLGNLQQAAQLCNVAVMLVDHHRKLAGGDGSPIDDILGSTAKAAVADAALGLFREQGKHNATLKVTGRDVEEKELAIQWDQDLCCWQLLGEVGATRKDSFNADVLHAAQELADRRELVTTERIASMLGKDKGNVSRAIGDLLTASKLRKGDKVGREQPYHPV